jgi:antitoxin component YwqK of YwqJK toxin-antitoxin module
MKNGEVKFYHNNGQLWEVSNWKNDNREGECKWYYDNGQLKAVRNYKDDKLEGECREYFENGRLEISYWKDGKDIAKQVLEKRELLERIKQL